MSEIREHKESLFLVLTEILEQNSGLVTALMGIGIGWNKDGSECYEVRVSDQLASEVMTIFPHVYQDFVINYERISQPQLLDENTVTQVSKK